MLALLHSLALVNRLPTGVLGTYHAPTGVVADGHNTSAFNVGQWGTIAITNAPSDGAPGSKLTLRQSLDEYCNVSSVNELWGMLLGPSEGGTYNNTNDTSLWVPLGHSTSSP